MVIETVRGRYQQGKIELDEPLDLKDGTEVGVTVKSSEAPIPGGDTAVTGGSWPGNVPDDFEEQVYADRRRETARSPARW